ncbi:PepSY domain-containing protein [Sandaracinobacter neustonicus]|uniref:PepSY domain-containing protein n=1 Tax=Sandaracinobacter neustonicus TaxID=1715348 RepID=A0A501XV44_9SPHN|nr:PepSY domain-containing protein [Sandaracinobacter neustonicus]TPE64451.1 PepSY domain-containing protein [Sandaracinobacter neustonicus]
MVAGGARFASSAGRLHRWIALIVGIQLLLWVASGLFMSVVPIERIRGEHLKAVPAPAVDPHALVPEIATALAALPPGKADRIEIRQMLGQPVLLLAGEGGARLFDARTGAPLSPISADTARALAAADFTGKGKPVSVSAVTAASPEYRGPLPAWRVDFDDAETTRLFVSADEGRVAARRTGLWRVYDFLWSLHIMDWRDHEDINNNWLRGASALALLLALTGVVLIPWRMGWLRKRRRWN